MNPPRSPIWEAIRAQENAQARLSRIRRDPIVRAAAGLLYASQALSELAELYGSAEAVRRQLAESHRILIGIAKQNGS
jgi:hypothetical protein